jgi:hypothetical protein
VISLDDILRRKNRDDKRVMALINFLSTPTTEKAAKHKNPLLGVKKPANDEEESSDYPRR